MIQPGGRREGGERGTYQGADGSFESLPLLTHAGKKRSSCMDQYLRHVQSRLSDSEFKDGASSLDVSEYRLKLSELDPGGAVFWTELEVFLVQLPAAVELSQLELQLDVAFQQFVLRTFPDSCALRKERMISGEQAPTQTASFDLGFGKP